MEVMACVEVLMCWNWFHVPRRRSADDRKRAALGVALPSCLSKGEGSEGGGASGDRETDPKL